MDEVINVCDREVVATQSSNWFVEVRERVRGRGTVDQGLGSHAANCTCDGVWVNMGPSA